MTDTEKCADWCRFYNASSADYRIWALVAVLKNDGEGMLSKVLKSLKLDTPISVVKACL